MNVKMLNQKRPLTLNGLLNLLLTPLLNKRKTLQSLKRRKRPGLGNTCKSGLTTTKQ